MAVPTLQTTSPAQGPTSGGDIVVLSGANFSPRVRVLFGNVEADVLSVRGDAVASFADVRTPAHASATVDVTLQNLAADGAPVAGERVALDRAYGFHRPRLVTEASLTRLARALLRELKRQVLENTSITVSVDYDDTTTDGLAVVALAELPSLVLTGPQLTENRFYSTNELREAAVIGPSGPEIIRHRPPYTVDLRFSLTVASDRTAELLNLMAAVATFGNRNRRIEMLRDPGDRTRGVARWEMELDGDFRTRLDGPADVVAFTCGLIIRGFDVDEGQPLDRGKAVGESELRLGRLGDDGPV